MEYKASLLNVGVKCFSHEYVVHKCAKIWLKYGICGTQLALAWSMQDSWYKGQFILSAVLPSSGQNFSYDHKSALAGKYWLRHPTEITLGGMEFINCFPEDEKNSSYQNGSCFDMSCAKCGKHTCGLNLCSRGDTVHWVHVQCTVRPAYKDHPKEYHVPLS